LGAIGEFRGGGAIPSQEETCSAGELEGSSLSPAICPGHGFAGHCCSR